MRKEHKVTVRDVAERAGVSISTVSRVMRRNPAVSPEVRRKVITAIEELGYSKSGGSAGSEPIIGLIIPDLVNTFFPLLIAGVERMAKIRGYSVVLCDSENNPELEADLVRKLVGLGIRGLLYVPANTPNGEIGELIREGFPLVFLDRVMELPGISAVIIDNEDGAYQAAKYILDLGHRRIVYLSGPRQLSTERSRYDGFRKALEEEGIDFDEELLVTGNYSYETAFREVEALFERQIDFSAIFAANDHMAFGAKAAIEKRGLRVPDDVSLMGFDDILYASSIGLTTVSQPVFEIGRNGMILLDDIMEGRMRQPYTMVLKPSMVIRGTCKRVMPSASERNREPHRINGTNA